jgi:hypothetical protein
MFAGRLRVISPNDGRIANDETGNEKLLPVLQWESCRLYPVVVIAFPGAWRMADALGDTAKYAARFHFSSAVRSYPNAEEWMSEVGRTLRTMICVSDAGDDLLIHEFAHWFLVEWCDLNGIEPWALPGFLLEGMAEATCASAKDPTDAAWERLAVRDWVQRHCLSAGVGAAAVYTVGESLVTYLTDELGETGFLETLAMWASEPQALIERNEPGWRESLGLPGECGAHRDDSG